MWKIACTKCWGEVRIDKNSFVRNVGSCISVDAIDDDIFWMLRFQKESLVWMNESNGLHKDFVGLFQKVIRYAEAIGEGKCK